MSTTPEALEAIDRVLAGKADPIAGRVARALPDGPSNEVVSDDCWRCHEIVKVRPLTWLCHECTMWLSEASNLDPKGPVVHAIHNGPYPVTYHTQLPSIEPINPLGKINMRTNTVNACCFRPFVIVPNFTIEEFGPSLEVWLDWVRSFEKVGRETSQGIWSLTLAMDEADSLPSFILSRIVDEINYSVRLGAIHSGIHRDAFEEVARMSIVKVERLIANRAD